MCAERGRGGLFAEHRFDSVSVYGRTDDVPFVEIAREAGAWTPELNLEPSEGASLFHHAVQGRATQTVPALVEQILRGTD